MVNTDQTDRTDQHGSGFAGFKSVLSRLVRNIRVLLSTGNVKASTDRANRHRTLFLCPKLSNSCKEIFTNGLYEGCSRFSVQFPPPGQAEA